MMRTEGDKSVWCSTFCLLSCEIEEVIVHNVALVLMLGGHKRQTRMIEITHDIKPVQ